MDSNRVTIAALLFIVVIIVINYAMIIIARSWAKNGDSRWMSAIRKSLSKSVEGSSNRSMDELRQKMEDLQEKEKPK